MHQPPPLSRRAQQRVQRAMADLVDMAGGPEAFADRHGLNPRTVRRIMHGQRLPPRGLAYELVDMIDRLPTSLDLALHRRALLALAEGSNENAA